MFVVSEAEAAEKARQLMQRADKDGDPLAAGGGIGGSHSENIERTLVGGRIGLRPPLPAWNCAERTKAIWPLVEA